ncbi:hypothetical protein KY345_00915 [Candidatus Woesearchaeota archaeon]|nr:hypothetical protein [Candidatus Woesearchaeota archaeon]
MRIKIFILVLVIILSGCAQQLQEDIAEEEIPVQEEIPEEIAPETPKEEIIPEEKEEIPVDTEEPEEEADDNRFTIVITHTTVTPKESTVKPGTTVVFEMREISGYRKMFIRKTGFIEKSGPLEAGDTWEVTLNEPGRYQFVESVIGITQGYVTVE